MHTQPSEVDLAKEMRTHTTSVEQNQGPASRQGGRPGGTASDNHTFVKGVLWVLRSDAYWCHMPKRYGNWKSNHKRFTRWTRAGVWEEFSQTTLTTSTS